MFQIPPPCQSTTIIGHDEAKKQITEAFASKRMHHAWLLVGPEGIGKSTFAYHVANMILSGGANTMTSFDPAHQAARLVAADSHPDLFVLRRSSDEKTGVVKDTIAAEDARKMAPFLTLTPTYGNGRVAIIDEAHALNRHGQNAILKVIEEPPIGSTVLLTATTVGSLLPTIRSRCRVLKFHALTSQMIDVVLNRLDVQMPHDVDRARLLALADGSVGKALRIIETDALPLLAELLAILDHLPSLDLVKVHKLADRLSKKADSDAFFVVSGLLLDNLQAAVVATASGGGDQSVLASKIAAAGRLDKALQLWESVHATLQATDSANMDRKLAFINAVSDMSRLMA